MSILVTSRCSWGQAGAVVTDRFMRSILGKKCLIPSNDGLSGAFDFASVNYDRDSRTGFESNIQLHLADGYIFTSTELGDLILMFMSPKRGMSSPCSVDFRVLSGARVTSAEGAFPFLLRTGIDFIVLSSHVLAIPIVELRMHLCKLDIVGTGGSENTLANDMGQLILNGGISGDRASA